MKIVKSHETKLILICITSLIKIIIIIIIEVRK